MCMNIPHVCEFLKSSKRTSDLGELGVPGDVKLFKVGAEKQS